MPWKNLITTAWGILRLRIEEMASISGSSCRYKPQNKTQRRDRKEYSYSWVEGKGSPEGCKKEHVTQCLELTGSCQGGDEPSGFKKAAQFLDQLCKYRLSK
jgi:hypothetical protein